MQKVLQKKETAYTRYSLLDGVRGFLLLQMVLYHGLWDLVHLYNAPLMWFKGAIGLWWQQEICCGFIFVAGFSYALGKRTFYRGFSLLFWGAMITFATRIFLPERPIYFGILTFLGTAILLCKMFEPFIRRVPVGFGVAFSLSFFVFCRHVELGYVGFGHWRWLLPTFFYQNGLTTYLGFPPEGFYSADYFPIVPWMFLFLAGFYSFYLAKEKGLLSYFHLPSGKALPWLGRHSLAVYLLHQPILWCLLYSIFSFWD